MHPSCLYTNARPFKIFISLLDKWEIGSPLTEALIYDALTAIKCSVQSTSEKGEDVCYIAHDIVADELTEVKCRQWSLQTPCMKRSNLAQSGKRCLRLSAKRFFLAMNSNTSMSVPSSSHILCMLTMGRRQLICSRLSWIHSGWTRKKCKDSICH